MKKKKVISKSYIEEKTGHDAHYWIMYIQGLIERHSGTAATKGKAKGHSTTDNRWYDKLRKQVQKCIKRSAKGSYDGNMATASIMGYILILWYTRLHRAKTMDPNRPVKHRLMAHAGLFLYRSAVAQLVINDIPDMESFNQEWDCPFDDDAKDGDFV